MWQSRMSSSSVFMIDSINECIVIVHWPTTVCVNYRKTLDRSPRLPSVQVNKTPARPVCGARRLSGAGLYHNMSKFVYFYSKNCQLSCLLGTSILFIFTTKHLRLAEAIFILYFYCVNDVITCCFTSEQHPYLTNSPACMRDPASIGTSESDPRPVCGTWRLSGAYGYY